MLKSNFKSARLWACVLAAGLLVVFSCKKSLENNIKTPVAADANFVAEAEASRAAVNFISNKVLPSSKGTTDPGQVVIRTAGPVIKMFADDGLAAFYVVNYKEGGFAIVSADRRTPKVLAFSDIGSFSTENMQDGLKDWLGTTKTMMSELRASHEVYREQDKQDAFKVMNSTKIQGLKTDNVPPPPPCEDHSEMVNALIQTNWGQGSGYNNTMPLLSCGPNGHAYTGCVPTAMAQIMRYHQFPSTGYNYSIMPVQVTSLTASGTNEIAKLMKNASVSVNVTYNCNGTGAYQSAIAGALINTFGYSSSTHSINYAGTANYITVQAELRAGRPVLFTGENQTVGHAWVCDGFAESTFCDTGNTLLTLHMNWGWDGSNNGWYSFGNFNPGSTTYNTNTKVIVGIKPGVGAI